MAVEAKPMWTRRRRCSRGLTLIEIMIALSMLAIITMALTSILLTSMNLQQVNKEMEVAMYAAQSGIDSIRAYPEFDQMYTAFRGRLVALDPAINNPPVDTGNWSLPDFAAMMVDPTDPTGLKILDGWQVSYIFPETGTSLDETKTGPWFNGVTESIDDNGTADNTNANDEYEMLPVMVRVSWDSRMLGDMTYELRTIIAKKYEE